MYYEIPQKWKKKKKKLCRDSWTEGVPLGNDRFAVWFSGEKIKQNLVITPSFNS